MPFKKVINYEMSGPVEMELWTVDEMSQAVGLSIAEFLKGLSEGKFCYHIQLDLGSGKEPVFNQGCYDQNVQWAKGLAAGVESEG